MSFDAVDRAFRARIGPGQVEGTLAKADRLFVRWPTGALLVDLVAPNDTGIRFRLRGAPGMGSV
jgi:hypothetical protein